MANAKQLPDGVGMPYVAIFGIQDKPILDPISGLPLGTYVVSFEYIWDEEKENTCEVTIETNNPDIIDIPQLATKMPLKFQWGYIYPNGESSSGPVKKMVIDDIEGKWSETGIKYILKCSSPATSALNRRAQLKEENFHQFVKKSIAGNFGYHIVSYTENESTMLSTQLKDEEIIAHGRKR